MPNLKQFRLPDLGEGLTEGEILRWLVGPGDDVALNQPIVEVETAKAAVEVPSPYAGVVTELLHAEGETVDVGTPLITFDVDRDGGANPAESGEAAAAAGERPVRAEELPAQLAEPSASPVQPAQDVAEPGEPGLIGGPAPGGRTSVLVGYGPRDSAARRRPRRAAAAPARPATPPPARVSAAAVGARAAQTAAEVAVLAKPPVRKLARDLGVDLRAVAGSGPRGVITRDDVEAAAGPATTPVAGWSVAAAADEAGEERIPVRGVRRSMAAAMVASAFTAPHVTEFLTLDVTGTMDLLGRLRALPDFADVRVSPLLVAAKALVTAVRRYPLLNSTWDDDAQQIVVKHYVNLGIAAATDRGLVVPNIKNAHALSLVDLARALGELTDTARAGRTAPADMQHGTITITNVGVFGVDTGTPILNPGEAAILALGAIRPMPWVVDGELAVRQVTTLGLSFDHRLIDGQLGSQALADVGAMMAEPGTMLAWS